MYVQKSHEIHHFHHFEVYLSVIFFSTFTKFIVQSSQFSIFDHLHIFFACRVFKKQSPRVASVLKSLPYFLNNKMKMSQCDTGGTWGSGLSLLVQHLLSLCFLRSMCLPYWTEGSRRFYFCFLFLSTQSPTIEDAQPKLQKCVIPPMERWGGVQMPSAFPSSCPSCLASWQRSLCPKCPSSGLNRSMFVAPDLTEKYLLLGFLAVSLVTSCPFALLGLQ